MEVGGVDRDEGAAPEEDEVVEEVEEGGPTKRARASRLETSLKKLETAQEKLVKITTRLEQAKLKPGYEKTKETREDAIAKLTAQVALQQASVDAARAAHLQNEEAERRREAATEKKARDTEERKNLCETAQMLVVETKIAFDKEFESGKAKHDNIWVDVHDLYMRKVKEHELPSSEELTVEVMRAKYNLELHHFRGYCKDVQRYQQSGAPAEDVEKIPRRYAIVCAMMIPPLAFLVLIRLCHLCELGQRLSFSCVLATVTVQ